jgi:transcriptional regulator with XRE-family HTH domain
VSDADPVPDFDAALDAVGPRLRALRQQRDVTLYQLSASTGISVSTLSRLESGQRRPTLELMLQLAHTFRLSLDELVDAPATGDPRINLRPLSLHGMTVLPLTRGVGGLQAFKIVLPVSTPTMEPELRTHEGRNWFIVLSGRVHVRLAEYEAILTAGEVVEFDTHTPHWYGNPGPHPAEILSLVGPQGERLRIRFQPKDSL